ncbi:MAG: RNA polymerase sigma factor [Actinomycetota bacterium]|nr:RNA polymerase sigma factor [Actinomycetota bacterium]
MSQRVPRPVVFGQSFDSVLAAARAGGGWAFSRLYEGLAPAVAGYLAVQGAAEPEDLTSEVFQRAFARITSFSGDEARFRSWVFTIAHNLVVDDRRRRGRRPVTTSAAPDVADVPGGDVEDDALRRLSEERVRRLCDLLVPDQRDVLLLRLVAGMTLEETATATGRSTGAVKALQHRAVAALRRHLEREGVSL